MKGVALHMDSILLVVAALEYDAYLPFLNLPQALMFKSTCNRTIIPSIDQSKKEGND